MSKTNVPDKIVCDF